jgi:hypothetical protein
MNKNDSKNDILEAAQAALKAVRAADAARRHEGAAVRADAQILLDAVRRDVQASKGEAAPPHVVDFEVEDVLNHLRKRANRKVHAAEFVKMYAGSVAVIALFLLLLMLAVPDGPDAVREAVLAFAAASFIFWSADRVRVRAARHVQCAEMALSLRH